MVPIIAVVLYGVFIAVGRSYFQGRPALNWRMSMALWNLFLSVFSAIGFCRVVPQLVHNFYHYSVAENFCFDPESFYGSGATGLWVQLFVLSKFPYVSKQTPQRNEYDDAALPRTHVTLRCSFTNNHSELFDTFFIVIHKKPLIFLHWYHHVSVLLYCWHAYVSKNPIGIVFVVMNYGVHAIMYFYYFLMAVKCKPKWFNSMYITVSQISQMVVGVTVTILNIILPPLYDKECHVKKENNVAAMIMYGSYLMLFLEFFFKRYAVKGSTSKKGNKQE
jgi:elongation of very long chain fatty acids protein 6